MKAEELPNNWEAGIGERSEDLNYTKFSYNPTHDLELRIYWDKGEKHTALLSDESGNYNERITSRKADSEDEAEKKALELMKKYNEGLNR